MKKVEIYTINGNDNYGNKLQCYALLKTINKMGYDTYTYWKSLSFKEKIKHFIKTIFLFNKRFYRYNEFAKFTKKYLNISYKRLNTYRNVVGSDQVWNYSFKTFNDDMFLKFSSKDKNISYAASFGTDSIPKKMNDKYINGINNIKYLSVRENNGIDLVKQLTNRDDCSVVLDPTMLLDVNEWDKLIKKPRMYNNKPYILCYFLGEISDSRKKIIEEYSYKNNLQIINILDKKSKYYMCGPREFLYLEKNASMICTDSFHSTVFGILYKKPITIFDREQKNITKMGNRISTLLESLKLEDLKFDKKLNVKTDYNRSQILLEKAKKKSFDFLNKSFE